MIKWDDKYSMGISVIDEEHKKLIGILNKSILAKEHNDNPEEIKEVLNDMANFALMHFATEETYMKEFNYQEYQNQKEEHRNFSMKIIAYLDKMIKGDFHVSNVLIKYLRQWIIHHIQITSSQYIDFFKRNGLNKLLKNILPVLLTPKPHLTSYIPLNPDD